jgi:predicted membrane channel-forming protein YqfA (hemolysin III family)
MRVHNEHNNFSKFSKRKQSAYIIMGWLGVIVMAIIFYSALTGATKTFLQ